MFKFDLIIVGSGHAGCEAAISAAKLGLKTLLMTLNLDNIALMPCNPAVGGPAKSCLPDENTKFLQRSGSTCAKSAVGQKRIHDFHETFD